MPAKMLIETTWWNDGAITRDVIEDTGQGAVDCPTDSIQSVVYQPLDMGLVEKIATECNTSIGHVIVAVKGYKYGGQCHSCDACHSGDVDKGAPCDFAHEGGQGIVGGALYHAGVCK